MNDRFIKQTSEDYYLSYATVKYIYDLWHKKGLFYKKLEEHLKIKQNE